MIRTSYYLTLLAVLLGIFSPVSLEGNKKREMPDFTNGGTTDGSHDWTLGPTGARGWIHAWKHTGDARQILITEVAEGSPASAVLQTDDVILGISGKPFSDDARIQFAKAVTAAEAGSGLLKLVRWRSGATENVEIKLSPMGDYSPTAPFNCEKSALIFEKGCRVIAERGLDRVTIPNSINALALLANGKEEYRPLLASYARQVADYTTGGFATWHYGYAITFLAEYVLATNDQSVMPGLERLALESARGQSHVGTWGHRFAMPDGRVGGYGCMNSPGIPLAISMVLAREAGVKHSDLDLAIDRAALFLRWYVDKGAIPYGDHVPWPGHEDNGKNSMAAVLFDLLGDKEAATFFAKMSVAAYDERERGHTGNFFNIIWAMPAVARCGPLASGAYWEEQSWYYDLARGWDGSFRYQGSPVGEEEFNKYTKWDNTGTYLLAYAVDRKSLFLTGRRPSSVPSLNAAEVQEIIDAGRGYFSTKNDSFHYSGRSDDELIKGLSSWSPAARKRSSQELGKRDGDYLPVLTALLNSGDRYSTYGAAEALGYIKGDAEAKVDALDRALDANDLWLRVLCADSLARIGEPAKRTVPKLLHLLAKEDPTHDPRGMEQRYLSFALFGGRGLIGRSLDGVDRELLVEAVRAGLQNQDGRARSSFASVYRNLSFEEIQPLLPAIHKAIVEPAPSGIMFADGIQNSGLELFTKHRVSEGIELLADYAKTQKPHGSQKRIVKIMKMLESYGAHAQRVIPQLESAIAYFEQGEVNFPKKLSLDKANVVREAIAKIQSSTEKPELLELNL